MSHRTPVSSDAMITRADGRSARELRPAAIERSFVRHAEGSALITLGLTKVICSASISQNLPDFRRDSGGGWITAEYAMLPRSTEQRKPRQGPGGLPDKRSIEISRFLGRCLRAVVDLDVMGPHEVQIDCDVVDADAGTRVAALTGGLVALHDALMWLHNAGKIKEWPLSEFVVGVSVALVGNETLLDPSYSEDRDAEVDLSLAVTSSGRLVEVHGASEGSPYDVGTLGRLIDAGIAGSTDLVRAQELAIGLPAPGGPGLS